MKIDDLLESMDLGPVAKKEHPKYPGGIWASVYSPEETDEYDTNHPNYKKWAYGDEDDIEPPMNPKFDQDTSMNLSNSNMMDLMDELGFYSDEDYTYLIPINEFISKCQQWLKQHIDVPAGGKETEEMPRKIQGQNVDYTFIQKQLVRDFMKQGWTEEQAINLAAQDIEGRKEQNMKPIGPRIFNVGRAENYFNDKILKALKIAKKGKDRGATHISAG